MPKTRRKVNIIGHRTPDTDSICSALAYTYLKNQLGDAVYEARRAGQINRETAFVLKHFGVEPPVYRRQPPGEGHRHPRAARH